MDNVTLVNNFKEWCRIATNFAAGNVIDLNVKAPRPQGQYIGLRIMNIRKIGEYEFDYLPALNSTVDIKVSGLLEVMLSIDVYRDNAIGVMTELIKSMDAVWANDFFNSKGIGIINTSVIRDLSIVVKGEYEERRQCDFFFYYADSSSENVEAIEHITGTAFGKKYET